MDKVIVYYGSSAEYHTIIPDEYNTLTEIVSIVDEKYHTLHVDTEGDSGSRGVALNKLNVKNMVISASEYAGVQEHVLRNLSEFLKNVNISGNMYIQNPPRSVESQLHRIYDQQEIVVKHQEYQLVTTEIIKRFHNTFSSRIAGQDDAEKELLRILFLATANPMRKPIVVLLYGNSGVGKTESVRYLSSLLGGTLFVTQFSMFQNEQFATYLFGGKYNEKSLSRDLLARETNVLLFDEFDKAHEVFHGAFYQMFDEGIYSDTNYTVDLKGSIIFCTSNYRNVDDIRKHLGEAMYYRFDAVVRYRPLSIEAKREIARVALTDIKHTFPAVNVPDDVADAIVSACEKSENARGIQHYVNRAFAKIAVDNILLE